MLSKLEPRSTPITQRYAPLLVLVQRLAFLQQEASSGTLDYRVSDFGGDLVEWYIAVEPNLPDPVRAMLLDAYRSQRLVLILDGMDEAPGLKDAIQSFVPGTLVPRGCRFLLTSRPEGVDQGFYASGFVVLDLKPYSDEQQRKVLRQQLPGSEDEVHSAQRFMGELLNFGQATRELDEMNAGFGKAEGEQLVARAAFDRVRGGDESATKKGNAKRRRNVFFKR